MTQQKTPLMGWASWNCCRANISEELIKKQADTLVSTGLAACGYHYVNIDDGFFGGRDADGNILPHSNRFPNGLKIVADYIHSLGLKAGIYSDGGDHTCCYYYDNEVDTEFCVGLYGNEERDIRQFLVDWGFDFLKVDWCGGLRLALDAEEEYTKIGNIIEKIRQETGKYLVYNVCKWQFPGEWVVDIADSWRIAADMSPHFSSMLHQLDMVKPLAVYHRPGHINDLDMLQIGNGMSFEEDTTQFIMWCIMSTPLMLGCDLTKLDPRRIALLTNRELIAINQDEACLPAYVVKESPDPQSPWEIWVKDLGERQSKHKVAVFLNRGDKPVHICATAEELGLRADNHAEIRIHNLLTGENLVYGEKFDFEVSPHCCIALKIDAPGSVPTKNLQTPFVPIKVNKLSLEEFAAIDNYQLVDVRAPEEFEKSHLPGAINLPYTEIHGLETKQLLQQGKNIILYCNTGKRSTQAAEGLMYLGFTNIYILTGNQNSK